MYPKHHRPFRKNPVEVAVITRLLQQSADEVAIQAYLTADGEENRDLLAKLAFVLGTATHISYILADDLDRTKRLHSGLRTVMGMSIDNRGKWMKSQTARLHELELESGYLVAKNTHIAAEAFELAKALSTKVFNGTAKWSDVAGAELYQGEKT